MILTIPPIRISKYIIEFMMLVIEMDGTSDVPRDEKSILMSPIYLSPGKRRIVVFGGGKVALRKCQHFEGFHIKVISKEILPELRQIADETIETDIDPETAGKWMDGADIVIAATSVHELNNAIRDISLSKGIMTNSAHGGGDVLIPSVLKRPGYSVTVSSEGRVPAFPPYVVRALDNFLDSSYDSMLDLLVRVRPVIKQKIATQPERAQFLADILENEDVWKLLRENKEEEAYETVMKEGGLL